jgi:pyruvate ferredoxin oxidoreductase beta subunit
MLAHRIPYVATASIAYPTDLIEKLNKAAEIKGFKYIHLHAPCPVGWRFDPSKTVEMAKLAIETGMWILFEAEYGRVKISPYSLPYKDKSRRKPIETYLKLQGRFKELSKSDIKVLEKMIDEAWETLLKFIT